ncbi:MAG: DUF3854 domain-containing protein, partial [Chloracidobacterium sp.]|nr:DUF3854 domain-containing protein [Chloracidobacterium sp.]
YQAVHKQAGGQMGERGTPDLLPAEKIRIEIFAEKLTAPEERARYLKLARQSAPAPELKSRAQAGLDVKPNAMALDDAERIQKSERAAGQPTEESERPDPGLTPTPGMPEERKTQRPPSSFKKVVTQLQSDGYEHPAETKVKLVRVTPRKPCPVCGRKKYCSVREDGAFAICTKVPSERTTKNGQHYIHILDESTRDFPRPLAREVTQHLRADARSRDEINRRLLGGLKLQPRDQNDLLNRGLDKAAIGRYGYKSIPQPAELNDLMKTFEGADLRGIPGFFRKDGDWRLNIGEWKDKHNTIHSFHQGYIIPIRDIDDRIVGCQIRRAYARDDEPRYLWLSSNEKEDGTSSGAPTHYRNIELARKTGQLILTEGALKADVAAHLLDNQYALIAVPGVSTFSEDFGQRLREQIPELRQVVIIFDSDQAENDDVKRALVRLRGSSEEPDKGPGTLREAGLDVRELTWGKDLGKGLDDLLLANPDRRVQVKEFLEESRASLNDGSGATIVSQDRVKSRQLGQEIVF